MTIWKFCSYLFTGAFLWSVGLAWGGYALGANWDTMRSAMRLFDIPVVILLFLIVVWYFWHKWKELRREAQES